MKSVQLSFLTVAFLFVNPLNIATVDNGMNLSLAAAAMPGLASCKKNRDILELPSTLEYPIYMFHDGWCVSLSPISETEARLCWGNSCTTEAYEKGKGVRHVRRRDKSIVYLSFSGNKIKYHNTTRGYEIFARKIR